MEYKQLIINPGSTSTKLAVYENDNRLLQENIEHDDIAGYATIAEQLPFRMKTLDEFLERNNITGLSAAVGRGGMVYGIRTGGYIVDDALVHALKDDELSSPHASNLGGMMAQEIGKRLGIPAFIYDAVTSGELPPVAEITGFAQIRRQSCCHVLNSRAMALEYAEKNNLDSNNLNLIVVHLGGGISACVLKNGKIIDSVGDDEGQFSPERAGSINSLEMIKLCYSGKYTEAEMRKMVRGKGGMFAHLGTSDCRKIEEMVEQGDKKAELVFQAQAYQVAKTIGLLSTVLKGHCDAIILTGGVANSKKLTAMITESVSYLAPVVVMPGENEMKALARGGYRILSGQEQAGTYKR